MDRSEEQKNADRLASFAIISDVSVGTRRREFQKRRQAASTRSVESSGDDTVEYDDHDMFCFLFIYLLFIYLWFVIPRCHATFVYLLNIYVQYDIRAFHIRAFQSDTDFDFG